jgi:cytochrome c-type protein NapC
LAVAAVGGSCAALGLAPPEVAGPRLFTFPGDWSKMPSKTVTLFYPGQASWQFLTGNAHPGAPAIDGGCTACHAGQEKSLGADLVRGGPLEGDPIPGKAPSIDLTVRAAHDNEFVYFQFRWATAAPHAIHTLWRYDGKQWVAW